MKETQCAVLVSQVLDEGKSVCRPCFTGIS